MRVDPFAPAGHPAHPSQNATTATTATVESDSDGGVTEEVTPIARGRKGRGRRKTDTGDTATAVDTDL